ncbi:MULTISPECIES: hypothetical protein [Pseudomonas]|uniref:Uncharacterized protein n=1 Tax=Pseudomonas peradeniyensis TaxID=2745488 RepID=A0ABT2V6W3_9PSED|nr:MULTISPECIES: hypothetical protein [Pseudomonas]MCU7237213.1 hypothetical protein [Pseudomonas peradeniyensis]MCU7280647.1 hypothetical protein [Pseudomonas peradeniyensis]QZA52899.1 hypothetical protein K2O50_18025 [Pseudomonas sp. 2hn]CRI56267.1 hypothetical protein CCOS191_1731 [Pseudomonas sp. CCOS 191]
MARYAPAKQDNTFVPKQKRSGKSDEEVLRQGARSSEALLDYVEKHGKLPVTK